MKVPVIWIFFFVVGTALLVFTFFSTTANIPAGMELITQTGEDMIISGTSRKLKGNGYNLRNEKKGKVDLEDYRPIDPVPSSKASIKHGPIQHGSPLIPYIPKPSPPDHPNIGGST